jgi:hypothetical protein
LSQSIQTAHYVNHLGKNMSNTNISKSYWQKGWNTTWCLRISSCVAWRWGTSYKDPCVLVLSLFLPMDLCHS